MSDRAFYSLAGLAAVLILALALVWPQGLGARSPPPFRRPLGPVDPEAAAAARVRKPLRPTYRRPPTSPPGAAPAAAEPPAPPLRSGFTVPGPGGRP